MSIKNKGLQEARDEFIAQWGAMGNAWGINRTMAQIHALLMVSPRALSTDQIMEELQISRGNAHGNLRDLTGWGLVRSVIQKGERKEYFEAEKDVWKMFCTIVRERKRREVEPVLAVLKECQDRTHGLEGVEAREFTRMLKELADFVGTADKVMDKVSRSQESQLMPVALKLLQ
ncbi:MAG: GbsR/MarR family transcriptional regulator [Candidatus Methylacidiphilales bacterium]